MIGIYSGHGRIGLFAVMTMVLLTASGCGDSGPKVVPVSGTVTIDGKPLAYGHIQVLPSGWRPASSPIDSNGRFSLTTTDPKDGCILGTHPVVVLASESINPTTTKWHAPKKYTDTKTSNLTVNITGPTEDLKIELTWGGGKPFTEKFDKEGGSEFLDK
ncbi:hypothetical protein [Tuwongella immobilis]|uniref:Carboxypeptidase regulatory-like domain-containing protein n=1 Tax=Tuwongella immobilis TaxID=692036 RepID=A0A6C2YIQ0_9BACT|nr:hypothetical protein [Tuwongella immobilis]VIP01286.1 Uncharacterized protein OS=Pirellula staleyi (strain ATCC 27377 / DSM 6068 / ICPB 4128) GN=Psta_4667 PE=4 SV=1 [Tuwongella immobilis]VTR97998.1 Uncharacterized protein OS=Pirellula staleyi (strain ATCC 27377 / DSM 6068 / ICPB 4128) GN=Psta_4667 PE=4 SV=1 [Tuwongella immobilis]